MFVNIMRELYSFFLVGGIVVNYIVEFVVCWIIFLIVIGLYMSI